ncbi:MAG: hypothetical protein Ct9H300mP21_04700 [Pseudomonadota bacterium]|nr:MAG: hypothetical protein Ct9H300mP21_04700 [Pseudomonadota bacterium]
MTCPELKSFLRFNSPDHGTIRLCYGGVLQAGNLILLRMLVCLEQKKLKRKVSEENIEPHTILEVGLHKQPGSSLMNSKN